jgi:hypothetical protein
LHLARRLLAHPLREVRAFPKCGGARALAAFHQPAESPSPRFEASLLPKVFVDVPLAPGVDVTCLLSNELPGIPAEVLEAAPRLRRARHWMGRPVLRLIHRTLRLMLPMRRLVIAILVLHLPIASIRGMRDLRFAEWHERQHAGGKD